MSTYSASREFQNRYPSAEMEIMDDSSENSIQTWLQDNLNHLQLKRSEMNELVMDYLIHEGFKEAADRFREEAGIEPVNLILSNDSDTGREETSKGAQSCSSNNSTTAINNATPKANNSQGRASKQPIELKVYKLATHPYRNSFPDYVKTPETVAMIEKRIEIRRLVEDGDILKARSLINLHYPELLDMRGNLNSRLQRQHLIELIRQQKIDEVLAYVHDHLSVDHMDLSEMERILALLAYDNPDSSPYGELLLPSYRYQLASDVNEAILQETTGDIDPRTPRLVTLLKLLLWTQNKLEARGMRFPKMTDMVNGTIVEPRH